MPSQRELFLQHVGQTSPKPMALEIENAKGIYQYGTDGKKYIDLISGISVSNLGHSHPEIVEAIKAQVDKHMHLMVYGEFIQTPQVEYAKLLTDNLSNNFESVYFVNSGSEANEGALKLAKRYTGRTEIIAFKNAYHGSTQALLGLMSNDYFTKAFRPLIPDIRLLEFNNTKQLEQISEKTACVIIEPIQGEAGILPADIDFLMKLREKCNNTGCLLIFDEIQTGFGRTGKLFAHQKFNITPDIFTIAKGMGGGMPIGAFVSSKEIMQSLSSNPILGHITTFGGHPVSAAAALANLKILLRENYIEEADKKGQLLIEKLKHKEIESIRGVGLFYSVKLKSENKNFKFIERAVENGIISDWFLHNTKRFRICPPLNITFDELNEAVIKILKSLDEI